MRVYIGGITFDIPKVAEHLFSLETYEPELVKFIHETVKEGDTVVDVGANIGYITAVMASAVGVTGTVYSFEPADIYYESLQNLSKLNPAYNIHCSNVAVGRVDGEATIRLSNTSNIGWNTMVEGLMEPEEVGSKQGVLEVNFSSFLEGKQVSLIKIDVEGYECEVLLGMKKYIESSRVLPCLVVEVVPRATKIMGYDIHDVWKYLFERYSFRDLWDGYVVDEINFSATRNLIGIPKCL